MKDREKLKCHCGCGLDVKPGIVWTLESMIRFMEEDFGIKGYEPIIDCGARCEAHNKAIGGTFNSCHTIGEAVDQAFNDSFEFFRILRYLSILKTKRIILYPNKRFIHWDSGCGKPVPHPDNIIKVYPEYYEIML